MTQKKYSRRVPGGLAAAAVVLLAACLLLSDAAGALQRRLYPLRYRAAVESAAAEFGLDPLLVYAFIRTESGFDARAQSAAGARGLMQITQETYEWIHLRLGEPGAPDFDEMFDPAVNIRYGCYYVAASLGRYGSDVATAAAAYHSGWGTVDSLLLRGEYASGTATLQGFPYARMRRYVQKIRASYERYKSLYSD